MIAHILGTLDDKIELNRQMNETLEGMAQALFKSWFVDFDPVIDNALSAGNKIPDALKARAKVRREIERNRKSSLNTAGQQFPDRFLSTDEIGWIPQGWRASKFQEIATVIMGQSPKGDTYNSDGHGMPLVNGPVEFGSYFTQKSKWTTSPTKVAKLGDLIVCVRGSTTGRYVISDGEYCLGRGVCAVRGKGSQALAEYTFKHHKNDLLKMATGSTFPNWNRSTLEEFMVIGADVPMVNAFDFHAKPWIQKAGSNIKESQSLASLRDTLLSKLLSGELRIPDAEKLVAKFT